MWSYIFTRLLLMVPTLLGVVVITVAVLQVILGRRVERMLAHLRTSQRSGERGGAHLATAASQRGRAEINQEQVEYFQKLYGFDKPMHVQLFTWLVRLCTFDF